MRLQLRVEQRCLGEDRDQKLYYGPCFACEQETRYVGFSHAYDADEWLKKQFRPKIREAHLETLRTGKRQPYNQYVLSTLEGFLCPACKQNCEHARKEHALELKREKERKDRAEQRARWLAKWRMPEPGEFDRTTVRRVFSAYSRQGRIASILFRGRVCLTQQCRGNSPAYRMSMWVEGKLHAHYYAWELPKLDFGCSYPDGVSDLFGCGLARWTEQQFQCVLASMKPDTIWRAQTRVFGRREDANWWGLGAVCDIGMGDMPEPCLIHTVNPDGSIYASLRNFYTRDAVAEFATERLHIDIRESAMKRD